jgi:hypothetical protein
MSRVKDLLIGSVLGAVSTAAIMAFAAEQSMDPVKLSPQYYTVRIDNPRVRVYEYRLPPGQKEVMHSHLPGVVFALSDSTIKMTLPDGTTGTHASVTGDVAWRENVTHSIENTGSTEAHAYAIELKGCTS